MVLNGNCGFTLPTINGSAASYLSNAIELNGDENDVLLLDVQTGAMSGTGPTMTVTVQHMQRGTSTATGTWYDGPSTPALGTAGVARVPIAGQIGSKVRLKFTMANADNVAAAFKAKLGCTCGTQADQNL